MNVLSVSYSINGAHACQHGDRQLLEALHDVTLCPGQPIPLGSLQSVHIAGMCMEKEAAGLSRPSNKRDLCVTSNKCSLAALALYSRSQFKRYLWKLTTDSVIVVSCLVVTGCRRLCEAGKARAATALCSTASTQAALACFMHVRATALLR